MATTIGVSLATMVAALVKLARSAPAGRHASRELQAMRQAVVKVHEARVEDHADLFREVLEAIRASTTSQAELAVEVRALVAHLRKSCPVIDP